MRYRVCVPGGNPDAIAGPFPTIGEAVTARDALWKGQWGGQPLVLVDERGEAVRPCLWCRGQGSVEGDATPCGHCGGAGIDADAPMHPARSANG